MSYVMAIKARKIRKHSNVFLNESYSKEKKRLDMNRD